VTAASGVQLNFVLRFQQLATAAMCHMVISTLPSQHEPQFDKLNERKRTKKDFT